jgi:hypothetical protein
VIVLRETEEAIKQLLPDEQDVNNFVRKLQDFEQESQVRITSLKKKAQEAAAARSPRTTSTRSVPADLRGRRVPDADLPGPHREPLALHERAGLQAAGRLARDVVETGVACAQGAARRRDVRLRAADEFKPVKIDGYARKRELLLGEISRRRQALSISTTPTAASAAGATLGRPAHAGQRRGRDQPDGPGAERDRRRAGGLPRPGLQLWEGVREGRRTSSRR